jgi:hypothetical protein
VNIKLPFSELIKELEECTPNSIDVLLLNKSTLLESKLEIESTLASWAFAFNHNLLEKNRRNPFANLNDKEVREYIVDRLSRDIVFGSKSKDIERAVSLTDSLLTGLGSVAGIESDFVIDNWTFCNLIIISAKKTTLVLAFLGED